MAVPRFSPDGKKIAFIGGLMSDQGSTGGDIWVVPATGGQPTNVTPAIDGSPTYLSWTGPDNIGFIEDRRGHTLIRDYVVSSQSSDFSQDLGEVNVSGGPIKNAIGVSDHGTLALVESGHNTPPEIWVGPSDALKQLTHLNDGAKNPTRTESVEWTNEGFSVQGWLTYPKDYDSKKKYPLIVEVHGGPSASAGARWGTNTWSELGYFLFAPNPRGSFGQGEKFTAANIKDFGYGDLRDIEAGMDFIEKKVSIDKSREGLTGWSYGGFMTMFGVTQTTRFRAAVAGAGISDWLSYYGENSIDQWMVPFFGATVYDDPAVYAKSSAISFIKKVKTPTLVIVGDRDGECPAPQSFEFWHALRAENVPTQLVIYPNEGHGFRDPAHIADREAREVAWFEKYMPAK
jgi:dipeptidyl aminopeptidase/acylaminoacyl peptidase